MVLRAATASTPCGEDAGYSNAQFWGEISRANYARNGTWEVVRRPDNRKVIGSTIAFGVKSDAKVRICAQDFSPR